ncbi:MAG: hypothetical protein EXR79_14625 [Myxococcales bacterium]|nr:hypothetical protein [Myxococcales bacterium]
MFADAEPRIFQFMSERPAILRDVEDRVVEARLERARRSPDRDGLEYVLNEVAYSEMTRLDRGASDLDIFDYGHWHRLARQVGRMDEAARVATLRELVRAYAHDVCGKFTPGVYKFASKVLPSALGVLFNAQSPATLLRDLGKLGERVQVGGALDHVRRLAQRGTIVVVPTHSSNLDSVAVGYALEAAGMPPLTYGAGKNLFSNPLTSFFMHNLGAYKVDRRIRHGLYKEVLKVYSEVLLGRRYHSLFFPGGTRARSNRVESHIKLGLLGTALSANVRNLVAGKTNPNVYVCPLTINYHLVLEAETLCADHLREDGRHRYMIEDDEFSQMGTVARFVRNMMAMEYTLYLRFGTPLDVVGNPVDGEGRSLDRHGRPLDLARFFFGPAGLAEDAQRDAEYTRELGDAVARSFRRETVAVSTAVVAFAVFDLLVGRWPQHDLWRLLRVSKGERITRDELHARLDRLRAALQAQADAGEVHLAQQVATLGTAALVDEALRVFGMYHTVPVLHAANDAIEVANPNLLYWYANRLDGRRLHEANGHARNARGA